MPEPVLRVVDIMTSDVVSVNPSSTAYDATLKMLERNIGSVLVDEGKSVVGIITKGDILKEVVKKWRDPRHVHVEEIMSTPVITVNQDDSIEAASKLMSKSGVSKLPVLKNGELVGILTATDIIRSEPLEVEYLQEMIRARFVPHEHE
ncbi:MAG: CBS domain-containing protein [Nitrososphaerota archaeon]|nr:CBS domain-containing protein [Nitrososphaerota archaeon]